MPCAYTGSTRPLRVHVTSRTKMAVVFRSNRAATHQRIRAANKPNIRFIFGTSNSSPTMWICKYKFRTERQFIRSSGILFVIVHAQPPSRKDSSSVAQKKLTPTPPQPPLSASQYNLREPRFKSVSNWAGLNGTLYTEVELTFDVDWSPSLRGCLWVRECYGWGVELVHDLLVSRDSRGHAMMTTTQHAHTNQPIYSSLFT